MVDISNFSLPDGAHDAISAQGRRFQSLDNGVDKMVSGHDRGVAFRFFVHQEYNIIKSKLTKIPVYDSCEMIEWNKDRFMKPTEKLKFLPEGLLEFDQDGEVCGGKLADEYKRWKQGLSAPGKSLAAWGVLDDSEVATLAHMGIFTVEQFAAQRRDKIVGRMPKVFEEAFERAIIEANGRPDKEAAEKLINQVVELEVRAAKKDAELDDLRKQLQEFMEGKSESEPKKRNRKESNVILEA